MLLEREKPINFVEVILDLRRDPHRMKFSEIAQAINVDMSTLKGWFYDSHRPSFEDGRALVALHESLHKVAKATESRLKLA